MNASRLPRILCVDDEPRVLEGLGLHLRKEYEVHVAGSGDEALAKLRELKEVSVIVSDMRMPGMDGATLLARVMVMYPSVTRILLTGEAGRDAAVAAINQGHIFRFLTKPCAPDLLRNAVEAGVIQHRVLNAEREILQETVLGCIKALIDVHWVLRSTGSSKRPRCSRRSGICPCLRSSSRRPITVSHCRSTRRRFWVACPKLRSICWSTSRDWSPCSRF